MAILALEMLEHLLAVVFPQVRNQFGVGVRAEDVALRFERGSLFRVVEEFAVEDGPDGAVFVRDRLLAVGEADDREPAIGEVQSGAFEVAVFIRAAVDRWPGPLLGTTPPARAADRSGRTSPRFHTSTRPRHLKRLFLYFIARVGNTLHPRI